MNYGKNERLFLSELRESTTFAYKSSVMIHQYYKVAGHVFELCAEGQECLFKALKPYEPFVAEPTENVLFCLTISENPPAMDNFQEEVNQEDEGQRIIAGNLNGQSCFEFWWGRVRSALLVVSEDFQNCVVYIENNKIFGINNALMVLYALSTADKQTALFHSSVVSYDGKAYMFLGKSGTGKSTHSSLWLKYIDGTELVNDDNPIVRVEDGKAVVYGSPWSGKTPCYRNVCYPVGAIVRLSQAPHNEIRQLKGVTAYAALVPSISGKRWDKKQAEGLHETESLLAGCVRVFHLDCLPDEDAAKVCFAATVKSE